METVGTSTFKGVDCRGARGGSQFPAPMVFDPGLGALSVVGSAPDIHHLSSQHFSVLPEDNGAYMISLVKEGGKEIHSSVPSIPQINVTFKGLSVSSTNLANGSFKGHLTCPTRGGVGGEAGVTAGGPRPHPSFIFTEPIDKLHVKMVSQNNDSPIWEADYDLKGSNKLSEMARPSPPESFSSTGTFYQKAEDRPAPYVPYHPLCTPPGRKEMWDSQTMFFILFNLLQYIPYLARFDVYLSGSTSWFSPHGAHPLKTLVQVSSDHRGVAATGEPRAPEFENFKFPQRPHMPWSEVMEIMNPLRYL